MINAGDNKGITLVTLVITVIIIIILSIVSIKLIIGDNGIITKAMQTKELIDKKNTAEEVLLAMQEYKILKYTENNVAFEDFIKQKLNIEEVAKTEEETYNFIYKEYIFKVTEHEIVEQIKGNANNSNENYSVKINYIDLDGNNIYESYIKEGKYGTEYSIENPTIDGYATIKNSTTGMITKNETINVIYEKENRLVIYKNGEGLILDQKPYTYNLTYEIEDGYLQLYSPYGANGWLVSAQQIDFSKYDKIILEGVRQNADNTDFEHLYNCISSVSTGNRYFEDLFYASYNKQFSHTTNISDIIDKGYVEINFACGTIRIDSWILIRTPPAYTLYNEIENIDKITIENKIYVQNLINNYNELSEKEKRLVTNYGAFIEKVKEYNQSQEEIINFTVPVLTSNTCIINRNRYILSASSNIDNNRLAFKAFDGSTNQYNGCWHSNEDAPQWLQVQFPCEVKINKFTIQNRYSDTIANEGYTIAEFKLEGSNDAINWEELGKYKNEKGSLVKTSFQVENPKSYIYYRWYATSSYGSYITIGEIILDEATISYIINIE